MPNCCPTCGSAIDAIDMRVDVTHDLVICRGAAIKLLPFLTSTLAILVERSPHAVPHEKLIRSTWGINEPEAVDEGLRVRIFHLRRLLRPYGVRILCHRSHGYSLILGDAT